MRHSMRSRRSGRPFQGLATLPVIVALLAVAALPARAERPRFPEAEKATLAIVPDCTSYEPGAIARLAALVTIERGWHVSPIRERFQPHQHDYVEQLVSNPVPSRRLHCRP